MSRSGDKSNDSPPGRYPPGRGRTRPVGATDCIVKPSSSSRSSRLPRDYKTEDLKHDGDNAMETVELSDLRNLIHIAEEVQKIDLSHALALYKGLMKKTKNDEQLVFEEKYLERQRQMKSEKSTRDQEAIEGLQEQFNILLNEKERVEEENKKLKSRYKDIDQIQDHFQQVEKEMKTYKADLIIKEEELKQARKEKDNALKEKNDALTRLSKEMGQKLTDNNPAIADLSDPNRALKMAEKYNELYDNEWTDAMEILGEIEKNEQINVQVVLETLKKCYRYCADLAEKQMESLEKALVYPTDVDQQKPVWEKPKKLNIPKSIHKQLKDCRKEMSTTTIDSLKQEQLTDKLGSIAKKIPNFVSKCIEICWFMCVLDPPVVLGDDASVGTTFDTNIYKPYTNSGTVVLYNVWPPLRLHHNGDLLVKGIVQPVKMEKKKTTERMDVNGMRETKAMKDQRDYGITYSTKRHDRLTGDAEYGHGGAGYDPMVDAYGKHEPVTDAYGRHEPVTDAYGRQYRVTKSIKTYDQSTRNGESDYYGDTYSRHDPVTKTKVSRTDTLWKEHKPSSDYSRTPYHQLYLGEGYNSHRLHIRDHVESRRTNVDSYDHGISRPKTNYVQENVAHFSSNKLVYKHGVPFIELNGQLYDYELYKRIFRNHDESHA